MFSLEREQAVSDLVECRVHIEHRQENAGNDKQNDSSNGQ